jgi:hypothetical protein
MCCWRAINNNDKNIESNNNNENNIESNNNDSKIMTK